MSGMRSRVDLDAARVDWSAQRDQTPVERQSTDGLPRDLVLCSLGFLLLAVGGFGGAAAVGYAVVVQHDPRLAPSPVVLTWEGVGSVLLLVAGFITIARATWSEPTDNGLSVELTSEDSEPRPVAHQ